MLEQMLALQEMSAAEKLSASLLKAHPRLRAVSLG
jgi:hypothetical protein